MFSKEIAILNSSLGGFPAMFVLLNMYRSLSPFFSSIVRDISYDFGILVFNDFNTHRNLSKNSQTHEKVCYVVS